MGVTVQAVVLGVKYPTVTCLPEEHSPPREASPPEAGSGTSRSFGLSAPSPGHLSTLFRAFRESFVSIISVFVSHFFRGIPSVVQRQSPKLHGGRLVYSNNSVWNICEEE
jgi:hypothetical protein